MSSLILQNRAKIIRISLFNLAHRSRLRKDRKYGKNQSQISSPFESKRWESPLRDRIVSLQFEWKGKKKLNNDKNSILENRARIIKINPKLIVEFVSLCLTLRKDRKPMKSLKKSITNKYRFRSNRIDESLRNRTTWQSLRFEWKEKKRKTKE